MNGLKGYLFEKGVSVKAANFTLNSRRKCSLSGPVKCGLVDVN